MKVYDSTSSDGFTSLLLEAEADSDRLTYLDGGAIPDVHDWVVRARVLREPRDEDGDFVGLFKSVPILTERAWEMLRPIVEDDVQTFAVHCDDGRKLVGLNVTTVLACLDVMRSKVHRFSNGRIMMVEHYVFDEAMLGKAHIFRIPETHEVLVDDAFVEAVDEHSLKGRTFRCVFPHSREPDP